MHAILSPDQLHLSVDGLILTVRHKQLAVLLAQRHGITIVVLSSFRDTGGTVVQ